MPLALPAIDPSVLLERLVAGAPTALLDVRQDGSDGIEAPAAVVRHVPAAEALASAEDLSRALPRDTVVLCSRGMTARPVAAALRSAGLEASVLTGGLRAWLGVLRTVPVDCRRSPTATGLSSAASSCAPSPCPATRPT